MIRMGDRVKSKKYGKTFTVTELFDNGCFVKDDDGLIEFIEELKDLTIEDPILYKSEYLHYEEFDIEELFDRVHLYCRECGKLLTEAELDEGICDNCRYDRLTEEDIQDRRAEEAFDLEQEDF